MNSDSISNSIGKDLPLAGGGGGCACCAPAHAATPVAQAQPAATPVSGEYLVSGMTCGHCVSSVTEELGALEGVEGVDVQLNAGGASRVTVASSAPLDPQKVREAVAEAGYDLVEPAR